MAQWRTDLNQFKQPHNVHLYELGMIATVDGNPVANTNPFPVTITGPNGGTNVVTTDLGAAARSAFGEILTVSPTPIVQLDALRGIDLVDMTVLASGTGASAGTNNEKTIFKVQSGTSSNGDAHILSKKYMKYRPGQGSLSRFTAGFTTGVANSTQRAGLTDSEVALCVGYDGVDFGVLRATGGKVPIHKLTITVAPTGTQTGVVTLNGVAKNVTITAGTTTHCAAEIAIDGVGGYPGWYIEQVDNTVIFRAIDPFVTSGTFSFSSTGTGTLAVGTFATIQTGVAQTEHWTKQADFNMDTLDGSGNAGNPSGMDLDTTKLNVYQISFRWLGVGVINYAIEDEETGEIIMFHREHYTNKNIVPHLDNPSFRIGYTVTNKGNTSNLTVIGASMMMAIEGVQNLSRASKSAAVNKTSLTKDDLHHVFSLRNSYTFADKINTASINLKGLSFGVQATDPVTIYVFQDPVSQSIPLVFNDVINSITTQSSTTATFTLASELPIAVYVVGVNGYDNLDVSHLLISEPAGSILTFAATSPNGITRITVAAMWSED
jgi:hypothetical protein